MRKVRYAVANVSEITPDVGKVVRLGKDAGECALFYHAGRWFATGSLCPHQNSPLEGAPVESGQVVCLRHGYRFDLKSGDCVTLGGYGLPVYSVDIQDDIVYVSVWELD